MTRGACVRIDMEFAWAAQGYYDDNAVTLAHGAPDPLSAAMRLANQLATDVDVDGANVSLTRGHGGVWVATCSDEITLAWQCASSHDPLGAVVLLCEKMIEHRWGS